MSKTIISMAFLSLVFLAGCGTAQQSPSVANPDSVENMTPAVTETEEEDADMEVLFERAEKETDSAQALGYYCQAARQGHGLAQLRLGESLSGTLDRKALKKKEAGEKEKKDPYVKERAGGQHNIAAAMMWLDMAILNRVEEAKGLRAELGLLAAPEDFQLYASYTRMGVAAPCP